MTISNDIELRGVLKDLDHTQRRVLGAKLVASVLSLSKESRVEGVIHKAILKDVSDDELADASSSLKRTMIESSTRCGADANWLEQSSYFVLRAANAVVTPGSLSESVDPLWQVVQGCRMARSCALIAADDDSDNPETELQYYIVNEFLSENS